MYRFVMLSLAIGIGFGTFDGPFSGHFVGLKIIIIDYGAKFGAIVKSVSSNVIILWFESQAFNT